MRKKRAKKGEIVRTGKSTQVCIARGDQFKCLRENGIMVMGMTNAGADFSVTRYSPVMSQVIVCYEGEGLVEVDGKWQPCKPGYTYLTPPAIYHTYRPNSPKRWRYFWIIYHEHAIDLAPFSVAVPTLKKFCIEPMPQLMEGLLLESISHRDERMMRCWLDLLKTHVSRGCESSVEDARLTKLIKQMHDNIDSRWSLEEMAKEAGMSKDTLRRSFLKTFNQTPMKYLTMLRMQQAANWLELSSDTIQSISERAGYSDVFAFGVAFKRAMGMAPGKYRKEKALH